MTGHTPDIRARKHRTYHRTYPGHSPVPSVAQAPGQARSGASTGHTTGHTPFWGRSAACSVHSQITGHTPDIETPSTHEIGSGHRTYHRTYPGHTVARSHGCVCRVVPGVYRPPYRTYTPTHPVTTDTRRGTIHG